jgi:catechol 2,3-dioxygenase-like lactoylglutathione lyase family enzyme
MKKRTSDPWKPAPAYSQELSGLTVNLLVRDLPRATAFARDVLGATVVYEDPDFAAIEGYGGQNGACMRTIPMTATRCQPLWRKRRFAASARRSA